MIYIKKIDKFEKRNIRLLKEINLDKLMLPSTEFLYYSIMVKAEVVNFNERADVRQIANLLDDLYEKRVPTFSTGIYAFMGSQQTVNADEPYYLHLEREVERIVQKTRIDTDKKYYFNMAYEMYRSKIKGVRNLKLDNYVLLHGDLHSRNIVKWKNSYKLIDWEYLQMGLREIEIAYYLIWDYLGNIDYYDDFERLKYEINIFELRGLISLEERQRILNIIIPMFFVLCICYSEMNILLHKNSRLNACRMVIPEYYSKIYQVK